jgi:hypothetical protein
MNDKEAIKRLKEVIGDCTSGEDEPYKEAFGMAILALEKQLSGGWIPFETEYDEDLKMDMLQCEIPEDEEEILVTDGKSVWSDTFMRDGMECYLDSGNDLIITVIAWQPLPEPFREVEQ